ncbi:MAG TPA: hypothetical protein VJ925_06470 [Longimicrobiales bacterium]|nr:hypothetical protein [Longimicrobiales bacterium]
MTRSLTALVGAITILAAGLLTATPAQAQSPIQIAIFPSLQLVPENEAVKGLRLSIYGRNAAMTGLDWGIVQQTTGPFKGLQIGLVGLNEGGTEGIQWGGVNITEGDLLGAQVGLINSATSGEGLQGGGFNYSRNFRGLQIALVNYAETLNGVQIGFINIIKENGLFPVLPIFNVGR